MASDSQARYLCASSQLTFRAGSSGGPAAMASQTFESTHCCHSRTETAFVAIRKGATTTVWGGRSEGSLLLPIWNSPPGSAIMGGLRSMARLWASAVSGCVRAAVLSAAVAAGAGAV